MLGEISRKTLYTLRRARTRTTQRKWYVVGMLKYGCNDVDGGEECEAWYSVVL